MKFFKACNGCQKKEPGCHSACPDYKGEKAAYEELKQKHDKEKYIQRRLDDQKFSGIDRAAKSRGRR